MRRIWLFSLVLSASSFGTMAFIESGTGTRFLWKDKGKVHFRQCSVPVFSDADLAEFTTKLLPTCDKNPEQNPSWNFEGVYTASLAALYGIPSRLFADGSAENSVVSLFTQAEREFRKGIDNENGDPIIEKFFQAYEEVIDNLPLDKSRILEAGNEDFKAILFTALHAFTPTYSNGTTAVVVGKKVSPSQLWTACDDGWGPVSYSTHAELIRSDGAGLSKWLTQTSPKTNGMVLTWEETFTEKPLRDGSTAFKKQFATYYTNVASGKNQATGNYIYPTFCIRRQFPKARTDRPFGRNGTLTLAAVSQLYGVEPNIFYAKILTSAYLEARFAEFFISERKMTPEDLQGVEADLKKTLGIDLRDWDTAEKVAIAEEKRIAAERAEAARIEQQRIARQQQEERQREYDRQQAEKRYQQQLADQRAEEERRERSKPRYARYSKNFSRTTFQDDRGRSIGRNEYDRQLNEYNEWKYGHRLLDASGHPLQKYEFDQLNAGPDPDDRPTYTYRSQPRQRVIYVQPTYVVPVYSGQVILFR